MKDRVYQAAAAVLFVILVGTVFLSYSLGQEAAAASGEINKNYTDQLEYENQMEELSAYREELLAGASENGEENGSSVYEDIQYGDTRSFTLRVDTGAGGEGAYTIYQLPLQTPDQGASYAVTTPEGKLYIIDGGYEGDGDYLGQFIKQQGGVVDAWFLTHPHCDHVGAFVYLMNQENRAGITVRQVYYSPFTREFFEEEEEGKDLENLNKYLKFYEFEEIRTGAGFADISFTPMEAGDRIKDQDMEIECMFSFRPDIYDVNSNSMVLRFEIRDYVFLITGDITDGTLDFIFQDYPQDSEKWKADIVQVPHHGFGGNGTRIYELTDPDYAFMDCILPQYHDLNNNFEDGRGNLNTQETIDIIEGMGIGLVKAFQGPNRVIIQ